MAAVLLQINGIQFNANVNAYKFNQNPNVSLERKQNLAFLAENLAFTYFARFLISICII